MEFKKGMKVKCTNFDGDADEYPSGLAGVVVLVKEDRRTKYRYKVQWPKENGGGVKTMAMREDEMVILEMENV